MSFRVTGPEVAPTHDAGQVREHGGFDVDVVDLADADIPLALPAAPPKFAGEDYPRPQGMKAVTARLAEADAFIIVTPEYNHSYPASVKALIDWHFTSGRPNRSRSSATAARPAAGTPSCTWGTCSLSCTR